MWDQILTLEAIVVDASALKQAIGSRDAKLVAECERKGKAPRWRDLDGWDRQRTVNSATDLVMARKPDAKEAESYVHAMRMIASVIGKPLPLSQHTFGGKGVSELDAALSKAGAKYSLKAQLAVGAPVKLPKLPAAKRGAFAAPLISCLDAAKVAAAAPVLDAASQTARDALAPTVSYEMHGLTRGKQVAWIGQVVGSDVVQLEGSIRKPKLVGTSRCSSPEGAERTLKAMVASKRTEGFQVHAETRAPKAGAAAPMSTTSQARVRELRDWYAAAARKRQGLALFVY